MRRWSLSLERERSSARLRCRAQPAVPAFYAQTGDVTGAKRRQAVITDAAWGHYLSGPPMINFLNVEHPELGGRPLDVAMNSDEGLKAVLEILSATKAAPS